MFAPLATTQHELATFVAGLRPGEVSLQEVDGLFEAFAAIGRLADAGKVLLARRAAEVPRAGSVDRDGAAYVARVTGSSVGAARATIEASQQVRHQPRVAAALRAGQLDEQRARVVADAAAAAPAEEERLVRLGRQESMRHLRERARAIKAAADPRSAEEKHAEVERTRRAGSWVTPEGAGRFESEGPVEAQAEIDAALAAHRDRLLRARTAAGARLEGTYGNLTFDAFLAMARASVRGGHADKPIPKKVLVRTDVSAELRGEAVAGETVDLPGYGPIPVSVAQRLSEDQAWHAILTNGIAVLAVTHGMRKPRAAQRHALDWSEPGCCVRGCGNAGRFEIDHIDPWGRTRRTSSASLQRLCKFHHDLKTYFGYQYESLPDGRKRPVAPAEQRRPPPSGPGAPETPPTGTTTPSASTAAPPGAEHAPLVPA